jgi:hypothetical protein
MSDHHAKRAYVGSLCLLVRASPWGDMGGASAGEAPEKGLTAPVYATLIGLLAGLNSGVSTSPVWCDVG